MALTAIQVKEEFMHELETSPVELVLEVRDFFDFLKSRNRWQPEADFFMRLSEPTFQAIWDNEEDAVYDKFLQEV